MNSKAETVAELLAAYSPAVQELVRFDPTTYQERPARRGRAALPGL